MEVLAIAAMTLFNAEAGVTSMPSEDRTLVQNLYSEGMDLFDSDSLDAAASKFRTAIEIDRKHAPSVRRSWPRVSEGWRSEGGRTGV